MSFGSTRLLCPLFLLAMTAQLFAQTPRPRAAADDRLVETERSYREAAELHPASPDAWWSLGSLLYDEDRFAEARDALTRFVAIAPQPGPGFALLALSEYETKDYNKSADHFRRWALLRSPGTPQLISVANFHWALLLTRAGQFAQAPHLLAGEPDGPALVEALGLAGLRMRNLPEDYPPQKREVVWMAGTVALKTSRGKIDEAKHVADAMLLHYDGEPDVHYVRGTLFMLAHDLPAADREYRRELQVSPSNVAAMLQLASMRLESSQAAEAADFCRRALAIERDSFAAHHLLGQALLALDRAQDGARELEAARQLAPENPYIRFNLAKAYAALGRTQDAQRERTVSASLMEKDHLLREQEQGAR